MTCHRLETLEPIFQANVASAAGVDIDDSNKSVGMFGFIKLFSTDKRFCMPPAPTNCVVLILSDEIPIPHLVLDSKYIS